MRNLKMLSLLSALLLVLALPALAQLPEEQPEPEQQPVEEAYPADPIEPIEETETAVDEGDEYELSAEAETDEQMVAESEGDVTDEEGLPKTASPLALAALLGLASIGAASGVRYLRRK